MKLFPIPLPARPTPPVSQSPRLWTRHRRKLAVWKAAAGMVSAVNSLNSHRPQLPSPQINAASGEVRRVWDRFHRDVFAGGRESIQGRRAFGQSGVHPLASLLHQTVDGYTVRPRKIAQVPLVADLLDEPSTSSCVDMLAAFPEEDSLFYASEDAFSPGKASVLRPSPRLRSGSVSWEARRRSGSAT